MNSHFQSNEMTCTSVALIEDGIGRYGSISCEPIQITPPRKRMTSRGIDQTISSMRPEYTQCGRYLALGFDARNHQAKARTARMVGTTLKPSLTQPLSRILLLAEPIGPCGSSTPPEHPASDALSAAEAGSANTRKP